MYFELLLSFVILGLVVYELVSGKTPTRYWKPFITRKQSPFRYWFAVLAQVVTVLVLAYLALHGLSLFNR
jgi:hypothetical protein